MIKKILVPVDFSSCSRKALKIAAQIARKTDAKILMLHLIDLPSDEVGMFEEGIPTGPAAIVLMQSARDKFNEIYDSGILDGVEVDDFVDFNKPFEGISEYAVEHGVDLIVMGSHGTSNVEGFFVGSNTEKVVRTSTVPVLVIKHYTDNFDLKKVVFASSFKQECKDCFAKVLGILKIYKPEIKLLRVNTVTNFLPTHDSEKLIDDFIKEHPEIEDFSYAKALYDDNSVQEGIFHYAARIDADLIALSTHGRQGIFHFLQDSIAEDIVNKAKRNILTVKITKD